MSLAANIAQRLQFDPQIEVKVERKQKDIAKWRDWFKAVWLYVDFLLWTQHVFVRGRTPRGRPPIDAGKTVACRHEDDERKRAPDLRITHGMSAFLGFISFFMGAALKIRLVWAAQTAILQTSFTDYFGEFPSLTL